MSDGFCLITGGCGYIGSHTVYELIKKKRKVIVVDNLINSSQKNIKNIQKHTNSKIIFHKLDIRNENQLSLIFKKYKKIDSVIHLAGLKSVNDSNKNPLDYFENNIGGTITLLRVMNRFRCHKIVFSSSATVYSENQLPPYSENSALGYKNPYALTKLTIERMLNDLSKSHKTWKICILRYFNPVGSNTDGIIGEESINPTNLFPIIAMVILEKKKTLNIFGNDYPSKDGTAIRDYIHVEDLARGHINALSHLNKSRYSIFNLGTENGHTVLEIVKVFEKILLKKIPIKIVNRREGDVASSFSDCSKARRTLKWKVRKSLFDMCKDTLKWHNIVSK